MNQDLNAVLDAALHLPPDQQKELVDKLTKPNGKDSKKTGNVMRFFGTFDSGDPRSADNEKNDDDLAESYFDTQDSEN
jgi:hypothetical protein